ncbi:MAG: 5'/3'-nucleotidase SurE, partial [Gammaproteobacteria bacterium]|nr:5'/3'-nucleotidase SurE [Gammaproteobacteria bacterium]
AATLVQQLQVEPLSAETILNVNVPDLPWEQLGGFRATRLGFRHRAEPVVPQRDPKGRTVYWVGPAGAGQDAGPGTDFDAIAAGYVSVTPLQVDLTRHEAVGQLERWLPNE